MRLRRALAVITLGILAPAGGCSDSTDSPQTVPADGATTPADGSASDALASDSAHSDSDTDGSLAADAAPTDASSAGDGAPHCAPTPTKLHASGCPPTSIFPKAACNDACLVCDPRTPNGQPGPVTPPPGCVCTGTTWTCPVALGCEGGVSAWFPEIPPAACY